ncbi:ImuA family protein [Rubripirellula obstinata]|uniref:ImuA family protein n=1 Tax=Rubripirellula obstinata TaxID=406547 RepID=UPI00082E2098|nr:hypothetical protein [Rubripirellula obstinata]
MTKTAAPQLRAKPQTVKAEPKPRKTASAKPAATKHEQLLQQLRGRVHGITTAANHGGKKETFSTGSEAIDRLLPGTGLRGAGLRVDAISEWVADGDACGAAALSLAIASRREKKGTLVVVADRNHFYPPAAAAVGIDPSKIIWVRPATTADAVWSIDQALRCTGVSAVWASVGAWLDDRDARRFQLAAEEGHTTGFLVRPRSVRGRPTFAEVRFHVAISKQNHSLHSSLPTWTLTLDRCQGSHAGIGTGRQVQVTMDDAGQIHTDQVHTDQFNTSASRMPSHESAAVRLASQLAHPTKASSTGAGINSLPERKRRA